MLMDSSATYGYHFLFHKPWNRSQENGSMKKGTSPAQRAKEKHWIKVNTFKFTSEFTRKSTRFFVSNSLNFRFTWKSVLTNDEKSNSLLKFTSVRPPSPLPLTLRCSVFRRTVLRRDWLSGLSPPSPHLPPVPAPSFGCPNAHSCVGLCFSQTCQLISDCARPVYFRCYQDGLTMSSSARPHIAPPKSGRREEFKVTYWLEKLVLVRFHFALAYERRRRKQKQNEFEV